MRKILAGMILGGTLTFAAIWILGYRPSNGEQDSSKSLDTLISSFPNKKLHYWSDGEAYEFELYGQMAFIREMKMESPRVDIEPRVFRSIWDQFEKLPGLQDFKNPDANTVLPESTHRVVFINDAAGLYISPRSSYSIPKDEAREEYRGWSVQIEAAIRKYKSEQGGSSNGG
jgi:hypothetical protein